MLMVFEIDDKIPFSNRHSDETIRQIIRYDSGYLKDLFLKDDRVVFSKFCLDKICRLTEGHFDNWEPPKQGASNVFLRCKSYATPYLYDFNNGELRDINENRLGDF